MNERYTFMVTDPDMLDRESEIADVVCIDDNGGWPDGNALIPLARVSENDVLSLGIENAGIMVEEVFRGTAREMLEFAHGDGVDLDGLDDDEIDELAWNTAQNLGTYYTRYSASDVIVVANDLQVNC